MTKGFYRIISCEWDTPYVGAVVQRAGAAGEWLAFRVAPLLPLWSVSSPGSAVSEFTKWDSYCLLHRIALRFKWCEKAWQELLFFRHLKVRILTFSWIFLPLAWEECIAYSRCLINADNGLGLWEKKTVPSKEQMSTKIRCRLIAWQIPFGVSTQVWEVVLTLQGRLVCLIPPPSLSRLPFILAGVLNLLAVFSLVHKTLRCGSSSWALQAVESQL